MIVKYIGKKDSWIKQNEECYVIEIFITNGKNPEYRLLTETEPHSPVYFNSEDFEIIDNKMPKNWVVSQFDGGIEFRPESFKDDFWEKFSDQEISAIETFKKEYEIIKN